MSVLKGLFNNKPQLVLIMAQRQIGAKPLCVAMTAQFGDIICVIRPQWVNKLKPEQNAGDIFICIFSTQICYRWFEFPLSMFQRGS